MTNPIARNAQSLSVRIPNEKRQIPSRAMHQACLSESLTKNDKSHRAQCTKPVYPNP